MSKFTTTPDQQAWNMCPACHKSDTARTHRSSRMPFLSYLYQQLIAAAQPLHLMLLSVIDVSINFKDRFNSFLQGGLRPKGLFDCALLSWDDQTLNCTAFTDLPPCVKQIYESCMRTNPLFHHYLTLAERPNTKFALPILMDTTVSTLMGTHRQRAPIPDADFNCVGSRLGLLYDVNQLSSHDIPAWKEPFRAGSLVPRAAPDTVEMLTTLPDDLYTALPRWKPL